MAGTRRVTLREASEELGVSVEAVRKRVKRDSLSSDKDPDGRVYVYLDAGGDAYPPKEEVEGSELVEELRRQNEYLERQVEEEREARRRADHIIAQLTQANAALASRVPELEAPREPSEASEEAEASEPRSDAPGSQTGAQPRPWWRRMFGG